MSFSHYSTCGDYKDKDELVYKLKNMRCDGTVMLEPRLQEYLKKKRYYRKHKFNPCIKPEEEFHITNTDRRIVRAYLRSKKSCPTGSKVRGCLGCKPNKKKLYFPSKSFRDNDQRVTKPHNQVYDKPKNMGMFVPEDGITYFEGPVKEMGIMDARDFDKKPQKEFTDFDNFNINNTRFDPRTDPRMYPGQHPKYSKYKSQYRIDPGYDDYLIKNNISNASEIDTKLTKHTADPRNNYIITDLSNKPLDGYNNNNILRCGYKYDNTRQLKDYKLLDKCASDILHNEKRYGVAPKQTFTEKSEMDYDNKVVIPKMSSKRNVFDSSLYMLQPPINTHGNFIDTDLESTMVRGMPQHTTKSYGYRNPEEHYFDFLPSDFVNEVNSVEAWQRGGESTRRANKALAKQRVFRKVY